MTSPAVKSGVDKPLFRRPRSEEFREWFSTSKVTHVVYHATKADFDAFDTSRGDLGAHFGSLQQANHVAANRVGPGAMILPVWLRLCCALRLKDVGSFHADGIALQLEQKGLLPKGQGMRIEREIGADWRLREKYDPLVRQAIIDAGYDGVVYKNTQEGRGDSYIVFEAAQVKSALGNSGRFLVNSPSLTDHADAAAAALVARAQAAMAVLRAGRDPAGTRRRP